MTAQEHVQALSFFEPEGLNSRGTLVVVPGRGEQPEVYRRFGTRVAFDAYRVYVAQDPTVDSDSAARQITKLAIGQRTDGPLVLVGSDSGALFAAAQAVAGTVDELDGLILAGLPTAEAQSPADSADTSWEAELDARTTCPTHRGRLSSALARAGAIYEPIDADWFERADLGRVGVPILGLHGRQDPITPLPAAIDSYRSAPELELITIAEARHDVLNDQSHRTVAATVITWLERLRLSSELEPIAIPELGGVNVA